MSAGSQCLACSSVELVEVLDLGEQHPVNGLQTRPKPVRRFPLSLVVCERCGHGQQRYFVDPADLFSDYFYASSTSKSLDDYSRNFATILTDALGTPMRVLEIASNDGILLKHLAERGHSATGIDPAGRMVERAVKRGLDARIGFWPEAAESLDGDRFDVVIGQNVLAHTPRVHEFLAGVAAVLAPGGIAIFQTSQADMVARNEFDTIYHEHFSFFSEHSAAAAGERAGLSLLGTVYTPIHGTSSMYVFGLGARGRGAADAVIDHFSRAYPASNTGIAPEVAALRALRRLDDWRVFGEASRTVIRELSETAERVRSEGRRLLAIGASAKGITALRAAKIDPDLLIDEALDKIGMYVDGMSASIAALRAEHFDEQSVLFLTAWNFARELSLKLLALGVSPETETVLFFPVVHTVELGSLSRDASD